MDIDVTSALLIALSGMVIVFLMLTILIGIMNIISMVVKRIEKKPAAAAAAPVPAAPAAPAPVGAVGGEVALVDVDEKTAACLMAIVSHETGIPLSELIFKKIKAL